VFREWDLWVRTALENTKFMLEFVDSGPGVKDGSRVFDPFYTTKPVGKGTGLGLSICYGIITEHGGQIRVRNVPPRGACFTIELPGPSEAAAENLVCSKRSLPAPAPLPRTEVNREILLVGLQCEVGRQRGPLAQSRHRGFHPNGQRSDHWPREVSSGMAALPNKNRSFTN
jgi:hypothetical protein